MTSIGPFSATPHSNILHLSGKPSIKTASFWSRLWPFSSIDASSSEPLKRRALEVKTSDFPTTKVASRIRTRSSPSRAASNLGTEDLLRNMGMKMNECVTPSENRTSIDWKSETNTKLEDFIKKTSMFATLKMMDPNLSSALSSEIIREACETDRSICTLYLEKAGIDLSLWSSLSIRFTYFIYYHCGIIPNTVDATAKTLLEKVRSELILKDGGKNLNTLVNKVLSHADNFFSDYLKALREYGEGKGSGSRDSYLSTQLQQPIDKICEDFGDTAIRDLLPKQIPFFQSWKNSKHLSVRILTKIFSYPIETYLNQRIRAELRKEIPTLVKSLVESSTEAAQQQNLPFSVSITRAILDQLRKFKIQISKSDFIPPDSPAEITGTEKLPQVVSQLLDILKLEPHKTRQELKKNLDITDGNKISSMITESLQAAIVDGCRTFFSYMTDPKNSEEFFYQLVSLSNRPFTDKAPSTPEEWRQLENSYAELKKEMRREAGELFQTIIHQSVSNQVHGFSDADMEQMAGTYCLSQRNKLSRTTDFLEKELLPITEKLSSPSLTKKNIQDNLNSLLSIIDIYRTQAVIEDTTQLSQPFKQGINQTLKPAYLYLDSIVNEAVEAKEVQKTLTSDSAVAKEIKTIQKLLQNCSLETGASEISRIFPVYQSALQQIRLHRTETDRLAAFLENHLLYLKQIHERFQMQELTLQNLSSLLGEAGLLTQLAIATEKRIKKESSFFPRSKVRKQIEILTASLPNPEKTRLDLLVETLEQSQSLEESNRNMLALREEVKTLGRTYSKMREISITEFTRSLQTARKELKEQYESVKESIRTANQSLSQSKERINSDLAELRRTIPTIQPVRMESIDARGIRSLGGPASLITGTATAALGIGLTYLLGSFSMPILGAAAGVLYTWKNKPSLNMNALFKGALTGTAAGTAASLVPGITPYAAPLVLSGLSMGEKTQKAATSMISDNYVFPKVMDIFDNMYHFLLQGHVWKWAVIDSLDMVNTAYRK